SDFDVSIDRHSITGGDEWKQRLGDLILAADTIVFVLSPDSANSDICEWEVARAAVLSKRILPVVCRQVDFSQGPCSPEGAECHCYGRRQGNFRPDETG